MSRVIDFLEDNHIDYRLEGNHHCRRGWVQICCPFCMSGDTNFHLGINLEEGYCNCYKCGFHSTVAVFSNFLGTKRTETRHILHGLFKNIDKQDMKEISLRPKEVVLPGNGTMLLRAYEYLMKRFPDCADDVIRKYHLSSTGIADQYLTYYKTVKEQRYSNKYANCIVIPNYLQGQLVSFQCGSYVKKQYITACEYEELIPCKSFLWGIDNVPADTVIVTEAAYDAMSVGDGAVHTHGCCFTREQINELATFGKVYVAYDMDSAGESAAHQLVNQLSHRTEVYRIHWSYGKDLNDLLKTKDGRKELAEIKELLN